MGLGMAREFHAAGMKVVLADLRQDHLDEALNYFDDRTSVHPIRLDVTDRESYLQAADEAEAIFGKIHVLVNNAGLSVMGDVPDVSFKDWDWLLGVNLGGVINGIQIIVPRIIAHGDEGHIVSTASMSGLIPTRGTIIYNTAKFAVCGLMESLYNDLKPYNIGVSLFMPGPVNTGIYQGEDYRPIEYSNIDNVADPVETAEWQKQMKELLDQIGMDPLEVGKRVLQGIQDNDLFILSHGDYKQGIEEKFACLMAYLPESKPERIKAEAMSFLTSYPAYREQMDKKNQ